MFVLSYMAVQFGGLAVLIHLLNPVMASTWAFLIPLNWLLFWHTTFSIVGYKYRIMIPYDTSDEKVNKGIMLLLLFWFITFIGGIAMWKGGVTWR